MITKKISSDVKGPAKKFSTPLIFSPPKVNSLHMKKEKKDQTIASAKKQKKEKSSALNAHEDQFESHIDSDTYAAGKYEEDSREEEKDESLEDEISLVDERKNDENHQNDKELCEENNLNKSMKKELLKINAPKKKKSYHDSWKKELITSDLEDENDSHYVLDSRKRNKEENHHTIVKLPVLLAKEEIDIDIFDSFDLSCPLTNITKVDWTVQNVKVQVLLPETTVFLKGIFIAKVEFASENDSQSLHTVNVPIPWEKIIGVEWIYPPITPSRNQKEYMFQSKTQNEVSLHREYYEQFADQIEYHLHSINFVWHKELESQSGNSKLCILGRANIDMDLMQPQYVELNLI
ncbi:hypothetical protein [Metabacillus arenae]|uniref:Uncharacterized protein n=1 Tax=Metabacillus arenae TaxID=2771434 RepID=A0A926NED0_9BACI|nr:hypothetical protein [Metabacillus arenae]MBD1381944.1 hypothetical protein [Metabacillus arenae]